MNQIKIISIFLLVVVLFFSCEKEEEKLLTNNDKIIYQTASLSSNPTSCGYIDELCNPCELIAHKLPEYVIGFQIDPGGDDEVFYKITPIDLLEESTEFLVESSNNESFILTNTTNDFINKRSLNIDFPSSLKNLYRLDFEKLLSNSYSDLELQQDLRVQFIRDSNNKILVNTSNFVDVDDDVQARPLDPSKGQYYKTLEMYRTELNMPDIISGSASTWMSLVDPVFNDCAGSVNLDSECVDSRDIIDGLINLETYNWTDSQLKALKTNYLSLLLDLNEAESMALSNANVELINELYEISECGVLTFCPSVKDQNDIIEDIIKDLIVGNNLSVNSFKEELGKEDYIVEDTSFVDCPYAQCVYNKILETNTPTNCGLMEPLFDSESFGVRLHIIGSGPDYTSYDSEINTAGIYLNISCDSTNEQDLSIASTIIHELIHAEIMMTLFNMGLDPNNLESFDEAWENYELDYMLNLKNIYNLNDIHHAVMVFVEGDNDVSGGGAVERIAKILWELNGIQLTVEHYYHLAWGGLRYIDSQWAIDEYGLNSPYYILHEELLITSPILNIGC